MYILSGVRKNRVDVAELHVRVGDSFILLSFHERVVAAIVIKRDCDSQKLRDVAFHKRRYVVNPNAHAAVSLVCEPWVQWLGLILNLPCDLVKTKVVSRRTPVECR